MRTPRGDTDTGTPRQRHGVYVVGDGAEGKTISVLVTRPPPQLSRKSPLGDSPPEPQLPDPRRRRTTVPPSVHHGNEQGGVLAPRGLLEPHQTSRKRSRIFHIP